MPDLKSSRLVWFSLQLGGNRRAIHSLILKLPLEWEGLGNITRAIVARLITKRSFHDQFARGNQQRLQFAVLSEGNLALDASVIAIDRHGFANGGKMQHLRWGKSKLWRFEAVPRIRAGSQSDVPFDAWSVYVHSRL